MRVEILRRARSDEECLQSALSDEDDDLRGFAFAKSSFGPFGTRREIVDKVLNSYDLVAMRGLAQNAWVDRTDRERILKRARELGDAGSTRSTGFGVALRRLSRKDEGESTPTDPTIREVAEGLAVLASRVGRLSTTFLLAFVGVALWLWLR